MSQYKRMVSYLYKYINGAKSQNTGFVRIELMDKQCRFTVQMRMVPFEVYPKVYLYIQKDYGAKCIEVSDMGAKSGNLVSRFALDINNIAETGYSFEDIDGLIVYIGKEMFFATSWVKDEINLGEMEIYSAKSKKDNENIFEKTKSGENNQKEANKRNNEFLEKTDGIVEKIKLNYSSDKVQEENINVNQKRTSAHNKTDFIQKDDEVQDTGGFENSDFVRENADEAASVAEFVGEEMKEEDLNTEKMIIKASVYDESDKDFGERILGTFPIMYPFVSGIIEKSVRIELKDIGCLPIKMWVLANNSFLLHGYCSYRHIIFAKLNVMDKDVEYAIGSPGIYNDYDEKIARQHGFMYFQPIGDVKDICGAFGYWLHPLK